ncbi:polyphosphate kinase 2 family protein [Deinococcus sonorensis]|uniref:Polyphosphate kinase 2 family protein n=2 Tax=Deinococcus sonorensis TaxID=309891 RepID=A0AAU7UBQ1_9DEIO
MKVDLSDFRVRPGEPVKLKHLDTHAPDGLSSEQAAVQTAQWQERLARLQDRLYAEAKQSLLVVLQARDAGGKDGTVKHVFEAVNPQGIIVTSFKVPSEQERAHDFLWRIHAHTPAAGMIAVFNRSHYEDVLVTRVHELIDKKEVHRRYQQICDFEAMLSSQGTRVLKLYLHISKDEQRKRLQDRLDDPEKRWKFNPADLEERARWSDYTDAYQDTLEATSTEVAPWYVIPADQKWYRNLLISKLLVRTLEDMDPRYPTSKLDLESIQID